MSNTRHSLEWHLLRFQRPERSDLPEDPTEWPEDTHRIPFDALCNVMRQRAQAMCEDMHREWGDFPLLTLLFSTAHDGYDMVAAPLMAGMAVADYYEHARRLARMNGTVATVTMGTLVRTAKTADEYSGDVVLVRVERPLTGDVANEYALYWQGTDPVWGLHMTEVWSAPLQKEHGIGDWWEESPAADAPGILYVPSTQVLPC